MILVGKFFASVPSGGVAADGAAAPAGDGAAAPAAAEPKKQEKVEETEESDDDITFFFSFNLSYLLHIFVELHGVFFRSEETLTSRYFCFRLQDLGLNLFDRSVKVSVYMLRS